MVLSDIAPSHTSRPRRDDRRSAGERPAAAPARAYLTAHEPWTARTALLSLGLAAVGAVLVAFCWFGGSDLRTAEDQAPWLVGSILGTVVFGLAGALWVITGFRAVRRGIRELAGDKGAFALAGSPAETAAVLHAGLVIGPGMARVHRSDCLLVEGKSVRAVGMADDGLEGCGVCRP